MSQEENSCHRKKFDFKGQNFKEEISYKRKKISYNRKKFSFTERNFLSQEVASCHRKKFADTGKDFLSQEENSFQRTKVISKDKISRTKLPIRERNFL